MQAQLSVMFTTSDGVHEGFAGGVDQLEAFDSGLVARIRVRVVGLRQLTIDVLDHVG